MKRIALKIDVDTYQGTKSGVPALLDLLQRHHAQATFFFSLGPDRSGCESITTGSLARYYGLNSRLYGRLLPSPNIGTRCAAIMQQTRDSGFETGIHAWDRAQWEKKILNAENPLTESEMGKANNRYEEIFTSKAKAHAAPGWRMNRHALRLTQRYGYSYSSDCRGSHPFLPVIDGELIDCAQIPTTLPTLDELLALEPGFTPEQAIARIHQLSSAIPGDHVYTLRAELEGIKFADSLERLLDLWNNSNFHLVALRDICSTLNIKELPRHSVGFSEIPGRSGVRLVQGDVFLKN